MIKSINTGLILLITSIGTIQAARVSCLCCDDSELIEFTVKTCHPTPADYFVEGIDYKGRYDLVVVGTMTASVPIKNGIEVDYENYTKGLSVERTFVYEGRDQNTCDDFAPGQSKTMEYEKLGCVLMNEPNFNGDVACYFGGHKISQLPYKLAHLINKDQSD